ncbi:hypothetical protein K1719_013064 [Acacia pycnantha]|nr:hypothetical protein K1719_013064 [Acacia pycnantha]
MAVTVRVRGGERLQIFLLPSYLYVYGGERSDSSSTHRRSFVYDATPGLANRALNNSAPFQLCKCALLELLLNSSSVMIGC